MNHLRSSRKQFIDSMNFSNVLEEFGAVEAVEDKSSRVVRTSPQEYYIEYFAKLD